MYILNVSIILAKDLLEHVRVTGDEFVPVHLDLAYLILCQHTTASHWVKEYLENTITHH